MFVNIFLMFIVNPEYKNTQSKPWVSSYSINLRSLITKTVGFRFH